MMFLKTTGDYVSFVLKEKNILSRSTFAEAANLLPADRSVRIHRSYIVAINKIDKVERNQVTINKTVIPVSDAYVDQLNAAFKK